MISQFEMTDLGLMSYFLGIEVHQLDDGIFISQRKYASDILKKFKMDMAKPMMTLVEEKLKLTKDGTGDFVDATYFRRLVGSLSDWAGDTIQRRSTSGYAFSLGSSVFSWFSKKQQVVALSTAEAEYMAATSSATQIAMGNMQLVKTCEICKEISHPTDGRLMPQEENAEQLNMAGNMPTLRMQYDPYSNTEL
ncbi:uncharacterized mitochondrial protein AtMg00810-like [Coffea arabica]|uniref:Uncharacterized mitochondrial protein AtMg00810-like n=1 Tax=Coffea arabica TaxID=13443 RepID=A0ABM4WN28_COFAR